MDRRNFIMTTSIVAGAYVVNGQNPSFEIHEDKVILTVPQIYDHEISRRTGLYLVRHE